MPSLLRKVSDAAAACARRVPRDKVSDAVAACARRVSRDRVSDAMAACARRVSRATRRLPRATRSLLLRARRPRRDFSQLVPTHDDHHQEQEASDDDDDAGGEEEEEERGGLWRRTVLMGQRCKPLDFPGAIHYDSSGRRLPAAPSPRSRALLLCRSACDVDEAATARGKACRLQAKHA